MDERRVNWPHRILLRVDDGLRDWLAADAERYGRTVTQSVRFYLQRAREVDDVA